MSQTSGVGGTPPLPGTPKTGESPEQGGKGGISAALTTPVGSLDQLQNMLIANLGETDGKKLYDSFIKTTAMMMMQQMQSAADNAKKAAQNMRMNT